MRILDNNDRLSITVDEAAKLLGVGRNTMHEFVKMDGFPAIKLKRKIIIEQEALPKWFSNNYRQIYLLSFRPLILYK